MEDLFTVLQDGQWHNLSDLAQQFGVNAERLKIFVEFLYDQGIVEYEVKIPRIKMELEWLHLLPIEGETELKSLKQ